MVATAALIVGALVASATPAAAAAVTLAWDMPAGTSAPGFAIAYRGVDIDDSGVVLATSSPVTVGGLRSGRTYVFSVRAFNAEGLLSGASNEVQGTSNGPDDERPPTGIGFPGTALYAAEGAAGVFSYRLALLNTNDTDTGVSVTFLREGGTPIERHYIVPGRSRLTVNSSQVPGLAGASFGAVVSSRSGVFAERTMGWDEGGGMAGAHTAKLVAQPSTSWYLAEGNAGFFETFILLVNPQATATDARVDFLLDGGQVVTRTYSIGPQQRVSIYTNEIPELVPRSFGTTVTASAPILCERAMYFRNGASMFVGGHASAAVAAPATHWFLAEGQTGVSFQTFVLLSNPNTSPVDVTVRYLTSNGVAKTEVRRLAATSRETIEVDAIPELAATDVSFDVSASAPVVVERSMYWPDPVWSEAHNSLGLTELGTAWALAEGEVGGPFGAESYILLANPASSAANVAITFFREGGRSPLAIERNVGPGSRLTVAASEAGLEPGERFGAVISASQPIAVERSVYWSQGGPWGSGTNETGARIR